WDYMTGRKPGLISGVNGMITGLVCITPAAGYVNGYGAIAMGVIGSTLVYFALNYLSRVRPFRNVDDTLSVIYTHGMAGFAGGLLTGVFADPNEADKTGEGNTGRQSVTGGGHGIWPLHAWQFLAGLWVICFSAIMPYKLLKILVLFLRLGMRAGKR